MTYPLQQPHTVLWDELIAEFPPLWNPLDLNFGDHKVKAQCRQQILEKCNRVTSIPMTMEILMKQLRNVNRRRHSRVSQSSQPVYSAVEINDTTPFYSQHSENMNEPLNYSQDVDAYLKYQEALLNPSQEIPLSGMQAKSERKTVKKGKRKAKEIGLNSHVIRKVTKGKRLIKISISDIEQPNNEANGVTVQYVVQDDYDELLNATEGLVEKIVKKLSEVNSY